VFDSDPKERMIDYKSIWSIKNIPQNCRNRFKALYLLSHQRSQINDAFMKEAEALQTKFQQKKRPLF
jgi:hypothetical protein